MALSTRWTEAIYRNRVHYELMGLCEKLSRAERDAIAEARTLNLSPYDVAKALLRCRKLDIDPHAAGVAHLMGLAATE